MDRKWKLLILTESEKSLRSDPCVRVQGERYFSCRHNFGVFVKPEKVTVGDFPVEELSLDDEEM